MKRSARTLSDEPVGIVISNGITPEDVPVVWAYVWGPAPEPTDAPAETA